MTFSESLQWLLVTDVDDTLDGDAEALREFAATCGALPLVLNSSRPRASVARTLRSFPRDLKIAGLITALGTEISLGGCEDEEWARRFEDWDRTPIDEVMLGLGAEAHPDEMQTPRKASFAVPRERWSEARDAVRACAPSSQVITSGASDFDVIPLGAGKGEATLFVADRMGVPLENLLVAGDSANDLSLFAVSPRAIAVGNARRELLDRADPIRTYFARRSHAAGLLEGLRHWGALPATIPIHGK